MNRWNPNDFYLQLGAIAGTRLGEKKDTLVFLDEIQSYPHLMTMLKFLNQEGRYTYPQNSLTELQ